MAFPDSVSNAYLSGIFHCNGKKYVLTLTSESITWKLEKSQNRGQVIPLNQLITFNPCDCTSSHKVKHGHCKLCALWRLQLGENLIEVLPFPAMAVRLHYAVCHRKHLWRLKSKVFCPEENSVLKIWLQALKDAVSALKRPKKLLVFINPFGGRSKGIKIYEKKVAPVFRLAGIDAHIIITLKQNHAQEILEDIDIHKFDGIISVGGDGSLGEILNGVILKTQQENSIDANDAQALLKVPEISIGVIPAGSTNCAAYCSMNTDDPLSAALLIVMGNHVGIDVCGVYHKGNLVRYAATFLSYGFFGDVIVESEKMRFLGPKRYDVLAVKNILRHRKYKGELQLQLSAETENSSWKRECCRIGCETCLKAKLKTQGIQNSPPAKIRWQTVPCKFVALSAAVMSGACARSEYGVSPYQHLGNGYCDVIIVSAKSRWHFLKYLLATATAFRNPLDLDFVQSYRVKEFVFNPGTTEDKTPETDCMGVHENYQQLKTSLWNCDGEVMSDAAVHAKIHCQLITMFGSGHEEPPSENTCWGLLRRNLV